MLELNDENFEEEVLKNQQIVLVDFWRPGCRACLVMDPIIDEIDKEINNKAKIGKLNIFENPETAKKLRFQQCLFLLFLKTVNQFKKQLDCGQKKF